MIKLIINESKKQLFFKEEGDNIILESHEQGSDGVDIANIVISGNNSYGMAEEILKNVFNADVNLSEDDPEFKFNN